MKRAQQRNVDRAAILEEAAKIADLYADEHFTMAGDTILADPILRGKPATETNVHESRLQQLYGAGHSHAAHAAQHIAAAIRALKDRKDD